MAGMCERMERKLRDAFMPQKLALTDESHKHIGHVGARPGGETHFKVEIQAAQFAGLPRVKIHQMVYKALEEELRDGVHALVIEAYAAARE